MNREELLRKIEELSIDDVKKEKMTKLLAQLLSEDGLLVLQGSNVSPSAETGKRLYFQATLIGYDQDAMRRKWIRFKEGTFEKAHKKFIGRPLLAFHKHDKIPIGSITDTWMENKEVKCIAWTDDVKTQLAIKNGKLIELSAGFLPTDWSIEEDEESKELIFEIGDLDPAEASVVVFPAYANAKIEKFWEEGEKEMKEDIQVKDEVKDDVEEKLSAKAQIEEVKAEVKETTDKEDFTELDAERLKLQQEIKLLEKEKILTKFALKEKDKEFVREYNKKYDLSEEDFEKLVNEFVEKYDAEKDKGKLPQSQREEIKDDKTRRSDKAKELAEKHIEEKYGKKK